MPSPPVTTMKSSFLFLLLAVVLFASSPARAQISATLDPTGDIIIASVTTSGKVKAETAEFGTGAALAAVSGVGHLTAPSAVIDVLGATVFTATSVTATGSLSTDGSLSANSLTLTSGGISADSAVIGSGLSTTQITSSGDITTASLTAGDGGIIVNGNGNVDVVGTGFVRSDVVKTKKLNIGNGKIRIDTAQGIRAATYPITAGTVTAETLSVGNVGKMTVAANGSISATSLDAGTGEIKTTGAVEGASVTASGAVSGSSVTTTSLTVNLIPVDASLLLFRVATLPSAFGRMVSQGSADTKDLFAAAAVVNQAFPGGTLYFTFETYITMDTPIGTGAASCYIEIWADGQRIDESAVFETANGESEHRVITVSRQMAAKTGALPLVVSGIQVKITGNSGRCTFGYGSASSYLHVDQRNAVTPPPPSP
jgi:hypothetical protein